MNVLAPNSMNISESTIISNVKYTKNLVIVYNDTWENVPVNISQINSNESNFNRTQFPLEDDEYIFDRTDVRAIFITLYTIVFCCCFFGKYFFITALYSYFPEIH